MNEAKIFLMQVKLYDTKINAKLEELHHLKDMVIKITPTLSDTQGGGSGSQDKLGDAIAKIMDLEAEIDQSVDIFVDEKKAVADVLEKIDNPDQYNVLHSRYVQYKTFEQIACDMHMTYRNVCYIHGKGLNTVTRLMEGVEHGR